MRNKIIPSRDKEVEVHFEELVPDRKIPLETLRDLIFEAARSKKTLLNGMR